MNALNDAKLHARNNVKHLPNGGLFWNTEKLHVVEPKLTRRYGSQSRIDDNSCSSVQNGRLDTTTARKDSALTRLTYSNDGELRQNVPSDSKPPLVESYSSQTTKIRFAMAQTRMSVCDDAKLGPSQPKTKLNSCDEVWNHINLRYLDFYYYEPSERVHNA